MDYFGAHQMPYANRLVRIEDEQLKRLHEQMSGIADRMLTLWVEKVKSYGTRRYDEHDIAFDTWMNFSDVYRKFIRFEQLTRDAASGDQEALRQVIEAYADMAVYGMSAVLVLSRHLDEQDPT